MTRPNGTSPVIMNEIYPVIPICVNGRRKILILKPSKQSKPPPPSQLPTWTKKKPVSLAKFIREHDYNEQYPVAVCGLVNNNNMCYLNSVLQALLHSRQFMALLNGIRRTTSVQIGGDLLVLDALVQFAAQYELQAGFGSRCSSAERFYNIITEHPNFKHLQRGRQEDAQEFLGYLLETLEQTFDKALEGEQEQPVQPQASSTDQAPPSPSSTSDGWTQVGKRSKPIVERKAGIEAGASNPIAKLFGGQTRNVFSQRDQNPSITIDPCQEVLLDISPVDVTSVQDAINHMTAPEEILLEKNGRQTVASKRIEFVRVPPVLIMFFKRFTFFLRDGEYNFGKITKPISIGPVTILAAGTPVHYRPTAIVYHHGSSATAGHYTTEIFKDDKWFAIDDDYVSANAEKSIGRTAYMAFYERI